MQTRCLFFKQNKIFYKTHFKYYMKYILKAAYKLYVMRQSACLFINPNMADSFDNAGWLCITL